MIGILAGARQDVDDQLRGRNGTMNALRLVVVRLGEDGVKPLIVEVDEDRFDGADNAMRGAVVHIQEAERALMAGLALDRGDVQNVLQVQDVGIQMDAIDAVSRVARQPRQVRFAHVFLDLDVLQGHRIDLRVDPFGRAVTIPITHGDSVSPKKYHPHRNRVRDGQLHSCRYRPVNCQGHRGGKIRSCAFSIASLICKL
ncbi:hypothetical protein [Bradyrhizobium elkanii]|uniref:hypothetical protein n=1 Tax=Bradyrhizobium elkanii TaxID=29448 RepID=UPI002169FBD4|nr:hypothetical protein [Bradyrhizobium elkanii]MCS3695046.1 hypothetical protein [Bradyrhizobium elkanii]